MNVPRGRSRSDTNSMTFTEQSSWLVEIFTQIHYGDPVDKAWSFFVCMGIGMLQNSIWKCSSSRTDDEGCVGVCF